MELSPENFFGEEETTQGPDSLAKSKSEYFDLIKEFQAVCEKIRDPETTTVNCDLIKERINDIIGLLKEDKRMLLGLANAPYACVRRHVEGMLYGGVVAHGVNVMLYSLMISMELGVPPNRLEYIGIAALCSRLGLLDRDENSLTGVSDEEVAAMEEAQSESLAKAYLDKIQIEKFHMESIGFLINFVKDEKQALKGTSLHDAIHQYAMVIHICTEFEKLTHQRTYGEIFSPVEAMKKMRDEMKDCFNQDIIKLFFNKLSIYPLGSFVKLSTKETAKIVDINDTFIMRPVVLVVLDTEGREKNTPIRLNLRQKPNIYIKKAIVDEFLTEKFMDYF